MPLLALACGRPEASSPPPAPARSAAATPPSRSAEVPKDLPLVVIVRADWCPACKKVEPELAQIEKAYAGKIAFLHLDVTDEDTTAGATTEAESAGVTTFFDQSKNRTATIGVFSKDRKELWRTWGLKDEAKLREVLDEASR